VLTTCMGAVVESLFAASMIDVVVVVVEVIVE
jgi:hypothetical protein